MERHAGALSVAWLVIAVALVASARRLELRTDLAELLPSDHPAVVALRTVAPRQRSASSLVVLVQGERAAQVLDDARAPLQALVPRYVTQIDWSPDPEPAAFADRWRWLYASLPDLEEIERLANALVAKETSPLYVELDEDPAAALDRMEARMKAQLPTAPRTRFASADGRTAGIRLWRGRDGLGGAGDHEMLEAVQRALERVPRHGARIRYTGPIAQAVEEQAGIRDDLSIATLLCVALILGVLWLAFGRVSLVLAALWPAIVGVAAALALARVALGSLNLNTAFLVAIILGNGINGPIVLIGALGREPVLRSALQRAILASGRGIVAATLSAATAYGVLGATRFRGFQQFGLIGGVGMIVVLVATFGALPPLLFLMERRGWLAQRRDRFTPTVERVLDRVCAYPKALAASLTIVACIGAVKLARDPFEWNLRTLRSRATEAALLWDDMEAIGLGSVGAGYIANTAVMLVDDPRDTERVAAALRAHPLLAKVRTLSSLLPDDQAAKLVVLDRLRALCDRELRRADVERLRRARPPALRPITVDDLPRAVRDAFTEVDGTRGRLIGIDADERRYHDWDGHALLRMSSALEVDVDGTHHVAASASTIFAAMLSTLLTDAPRLAILSLALVTLLLVAVFRRDAPPVLSALALGLVWLAGAAGLSGLRLNFMSFAAIPISIGVGADYAANMWSRRQRGAAAMIALCSLTTIIGYSTLLLGRNGALRSFGLLCDIGELTCLLAALLSPALFRGRR